MAEPFWILAKASVQATAFPAGTDDRPYICDRRNSTLMDARSFKSFRPGFEEFGATAAATKPESDVHAAIRSSGAVRDNPLRKEGCSGLCDAEPPQGDECAKPESDQRVAGSVRGCSFDDPQIRGAIITGAGELAFIAGADIGELAKATPIEAERQPRAGQKLLTLVEDLGEPVIAAVNGLALGGGGCETALACTIRLANATAKFGQPEIKLGTDDCR
jgi:hypothetical protein